MSKTLKPSSGVGAELRDVLIRELSIPKRAKWFEVRFAVNEPVTVRCEYFPEELPPAEEGHEDPEAPSYGGLNG